MATPAAPADIAAAVGSDVETTLYGDLPEDFWGESREAGDSGAQVVTMAAHQVDDAPGSKPDLESSGVGDPVGGDDAVPLFMSPTGDSDLPLPTNTAGQGDPPSAPEGERFEQLQALFPGRIIEVTRRVQESTGEPATVGGPGDVTAGDYSGSDDYADAAINESADEPRYDTAAEAAAEE